MRHGKQAAPHVLRAVPTAYAVVVLHLFSAGGLMMQLPQRLANVSMGTSAAAQLGWKCKIEQSGATTAAQK